MNIQEDYCDFETSKLLKEKGFDEKCRGGYHSEFDDNGNPIVMFEEWMAQPYNNDFVDEGFLCSAPTHQMAMKWLREEHKIYIVISPVSGKGYGAILCDVGDFDDFNYIGETDYFFHPEEAVESGIKYALENLI